MTTTDETPTDTTAERFGLTDRHPRSAGLAGMLRGRKGADQAEEATETVPEGLDGIPDPATAYSDSLTAADLLDLERCEQAVRSHHATFWETGKALDAVAQRHLYRARYETFDELLEDWDVSLADSSRMRRGWPLAARLLPEVPKLSRSHVEALLPAVKTYGTEAAAALHGVLREALPRVTAQAIAEVVRELPGLDESEEQPTAVIRLQAEKILTDPDDEPNGEGEKNGATAPDAALKQAARQRAVQMANELKRGRMSHRELTHTLTAAFADTEDPRVYKALIRWMKERESKQQ
ncbi:hypothetical protein LXH09_37090 [Streptomyces sp. CS7]|uniref:hypothetical protein n=1 Tax=Streptomyces sp. CS-7 TaxID=2906769 RepID=UPI0021B4D08C|nr:hypothetical protein [Streptomyces sp. CS-7]MCT6782240.1 hypothetical protein [Streptomyces sp. CS-7]